MSEAPHETGVDERWEAILDVALEEGKGRLRRTCDDTFHGDGYKMKVLDASSGAILPSASNDALILANLAVSSIIHRADLPSEQGQILQGHRRHYLVMPANDPSYVLAIGINESIDID